MINKVMFDMIDYFDGDAKRIQHAIKVYSMAKAIASENEEPDELLIIELAAILHDIGIHQCEKLHKSVSGKLQEKYGPPIAKQILSHYYDDSIIEKVCEIISKHHTYGKKTTTAHQIIIEADIIINYLENDFSEKAFRNAVKKLFKTSTAIKISNHI